MGKKKRNRKDRITILSPAEIKARREEQIMKDLARDARKAAEAKRVEKWGLNSSQLGGDVTERDDEGRAVSVSAPLPAYAGVTVRRDQSGKPRGAWLSNPFKLLRDKGVLDHDQANAGFHLLDIYAKSKGLDGGPELRIFDHVDGNSGDGWAIEDRKKFYGALYADILSELTPVTAKLAAAFAVALIEEDRPVSWAGIVERITGHTKTARQSARMAQLCDELLMRIPVCLKRVG